MNKKQTLPELNKRIRELQKQDSPGDVNSIYWKMEQFARYGEIRGLKIARAILLDQDPESTEVLDPMQ